MCIQSTKSYFYFIYSVCVWMFAALWAAECQHVGWWMWGFQISLLPSYTSWSSSDFTLGDIWRIWHILHWWRWPMNNTAANYWNPSMQLCCMKTTPTVGCWKKWKAVNINLLLCLYLWLFFLSFLSSLPCSRLGPPCWWTAAVSDVRPADMKWCWIATASTAFNEICW